MATEAFLWSWKVKVFMLLYRCARAHTHTHTHTSADLIARASLSKGEWVNKSAASRAKHNAAIPAAHLTKHIMFYTRVSSVWRDTNAGICRIIHTNTWKNKADPSSDLNPSDEWFELHISDSLNTSAARHVSTKTSLFYVINEV